MKWDRWRKGREREREREGERGREGERERERERWWWVEYNKVKYIAYILLCTCIIIITRIKNNLFVSFS